MRILVEKSRRPRRWAGVAMAAALMVAAWCVERPGEPASRAATDVDAATPDPGSSFLDVLRPPSSLSGGAWPGAATADDPLELLPAAHQETLPVDAALSAAPASQSAQFTGLAESRSVSTPGAMPTR